MIKDFLDCQCGKYFPLIIAMRVQGRPGGETQHQLDLTIGVIGAGWQAREENVFLCLILQLKWCGILVVSRS